MFILLLYVISYLMQIPFSNSIPTLANSTITSWESISLSLTSDNITEYLLIFSPIKEQETSGDIILYTNHEISTIQIYVYTDLSSISTDSFGEYINYNWILSEKDYLRINASDPNYKLNSNYYFIIKLIHLDFAGTITIYNELDTGNIQSNKRMDIKHLSNKHQLSFIFDNIEFNEYIVFAFVFENNVIYDIKNASLTISTISGNVLKQWNTFDKSLYVYSHNESKSIYNDTTYMIEINIGNDNTSEFRLNMEIEVSTKAEILNYCEHNEYIKMNLVPNINYYFYINTRDYTINEENSLEVSLNDKIYFNNETLLIYNGFLNITELDIFNSLSKREFDNFIKRRGEFETQSILLPYIKEHSFQMYFVISIRLNITDVQTLPELYLGVPQRVNTFHLTLDQFDPHTNIVEVDTYINSGKVPTFFKIIYNSSILSKYRSLSFFIKDLQLSIIMPGTMLLANKLPNTNYRWSRFYIVDNEHSAYNNTITFGFLSSFNTTTVQIGLIDNAVIYLMDSHRKLNQPFNMELTNCKQTLYYIEAFDEFIKSKVSILFEVLYGNYSINYYNNIDSPLIISKDNSGLDISNNKFFSLENDNYNVFKINCNSPVNIKNTFVNALYYKEKETIIKDGDDMYLYLSRKFLYEFILDTIKVGYYYKITIYTFHTAKLEIEAQGQNHTLSNENTEISFVYQGMFSTSTLPDTSSQPRIKIFSQRNDGTYIRIKMASNGIMNKIIEGNSEITYNKNKVIHRLRNDIVYDYLDIAIYSKRKVNKIQMKYSFDWYNENNMNAPLPQSEFDFQNETMFHFANPYNKYYGHNKQNDTFYFTIDILNQNKDDYNVYINIKYYNNEEMSTSLGGNVVYYNKKYRLTNGNENMDSIVFYISDINTNITTTNTSLQLELIYGNNEIIDTIDNINEHEFIMYNNVYNGLLFRIVNKENDNTNNNNNDNEFPLYLNYFYTNKNEFNKYIISNNTFINYTYADKMLVVNWDLLLLNTNNVSYYLYFLPLYSNMLINNITSLSQLTPNYTITNASSIKVKIIPGKYKLNIIAKCNDDVFRYEKIYNTIDVNVHNEKHLILATIIIIFVILLILIILMITLKKRRGFKYKMNLFSKRLSNDDSLMDKVKQQEEGMFQLFGEEVD